METFLKYCKLVEVKDFKYEYNANYHAISKLLTAHINYKNNIL